MKKAFLSHSSFDKEFVKLVADDLGSANCHYDERTFEPSSESTTEILNALAQSELFVYFFSAKAMESPWVKKELMYAEQLFFNGTISKIAIFPIDNSSRSSLPISMQPFVVQTLHHPKLVGLRIKSLLSSEGKKLQARFIGRDLAIHSLKESIRDQKEKGRGGVFISGMPGIGRARLMRRLMEDLYPFVTENWVEINLGAYEGEIVLFERLCDYFNFSENFENPKKEAERFLTLNPVEKLEKFRSIFSAVQDSKQVVLLRVKDDLITSDGKISGWILNILRGIKASYPVLIVTSVRGPSPAALLSAQDLITFKVNAIDIESAKQLLVMQCLDNGITIPMLLQDQIIEAVGGHPGLIELSVNLIKKVGISRFRIDLDSRQQKSAIEEYVENAINNLNLGLQEKLILLLLEELGGASREDILFAFENNGNEDEITKKLAAVLDYSLAEDYGGEIHAASHLRLIMRRWKADRSFQEELVSARKKLVTILDQIPNLEGSSYLALHAPIAAAIRQNGTFENPLVSRPLLAAQQLRVARRLYDEREYKNAGAHAKNAFNNKIALSPDGVTESLRIMGLVGVRLKDETLKNICYEWLDKDTDEKVRKIVSFIRGFEKRSAGHFTEAEKYLTAALNSRGDGDFHVLRELAASLLELGRPGEAERYASKALAIAPNNPFVLDIFVACLIERLNQEGLNAAIENQCEKSIEKLVSSDEREGKNFSPRRKIEFAVVRKDDQELNLLLQIYTSFSGSYWYRTAKAQQAYRKGDGRLALQCINGLFRPEGSHDSDELLRFGQIRRLRILSLGLSGQFDEAVTEYKRNIQNFNNEDLSEIKRILAHYIAKSKTVLSKEVKEFAASV